MKHEKKVSLFVSSPDEGLAVIFLNHKVIFCCPNKKLLMVLPLGSAFLPFQPFHPKDKKFITIHPFQQLSV
jgi:hypothetical protein